MTRSTAAGRLRGLRQRNGRAHFGRDRLGHVAEAALIDGDDFVEDGFALIDRGDGPGFERLLGSGDDLAGLRTGLFEQLPGLALGARTDFGRAIAGLLQFVGHPAFGRGQIGLGFVGRSQAIGDALAALIEGLDDRRPDELRGKPPEREKDRDLDEQCRIDVHE